jgi:hypothetical protein
MLDEALYRQGHANETAPRDWQFVSHVWNDRHLRSADRRAIDRKRRIYKRTGKNGERAFQAKCAGCHGEDLRSTDVEALDLTEGAFNFGWQGKTPGRVNRPREAPTEPHLPPPRRPLSPIPF